MALLEILTLDKYVISRRTNNDGKVTGVYYKGAYSNELQGKYPFKEIDWNEELFQNFKLLKENPPKYLIVKNDVISFEDTSPVKSWNDFIDSFVQVRNNLVHGAKFFKSGNLKLEDRDCELIKSSIAFIDFLEEEMRLTSLE